MHQPIKDGLEDYLAGETGLPDEFSAHLQSCRECAETVHAIRKQAGLLASLRTSAEPRPGFYGRVLDRIEQQVRPTIWSVMLEPVFGRSIAVACAVTTLILGAYLITTEPGDRNQPAAAAVVTETHESTQQSAATVQQDRDAVLVNLASFREN